MNEVPVGLAELLADRAVLAVHLVLGDRRAAGGAAGQEIGRGPVGDRAGGGLAGRGRAAGRRAAGRRTSVVSEYGGSVWLVAVPDWPVVMPVAPLMYVEHRRRAPDAA